jgi:superfamily I DNA/RNA helicase
MKRRDIILGPPGTGKTRYLITRLEDAFDRGVAPEEVAFLAFTRKAADVAVQRAVETFGFARNRFRYFRTIHSLAFHENKISRQAVMRPENFKEMAEEYGWDFTAAYDNYEERPSYGTGAGDELLRCYDLAKARGVHVLQEARDGNYRFGEFAIEHFVRQFEDYKSRNGLLTFNDFLTKPVELDVKMVIIDEAQDLTHLQWEFVRNSFRSCPTVLIAGDDDQCIYQWSGADLRFFLTIDAHVVNLNQSFRCKQKIWEVCDEISSRIASRYPKKWRPVASGGSVDVRRDPFEVDVSSGEWLILVRKNKLKYPYINLLMNSGRNFHDGLSWMSEKPWFRGYRSYVRLRAGEKISHQDVLQLNRFTTLAKFPLNLYEYVWEDIKWGFEDRKEWFEICDVLNLEQRAFIRNMRDSHEGPGSIKLSTIHAAKGGEADNVLLDTRLDGIPARQFRKDPDSERRVWYVGVSRARNKLILSGASRNAALSM